MHTRYRSPLGQINGFCRVGHSSSVGTSFPDVLQRQLLQQLVMWRLLTNKLARQLKTSPVKLQFWSLTGPLRTIGFLDATYRINEDWSSQRCMTVFFFFKKKKNYESIPRRMEFHLVVLWTTKVKRLREQYSQQPWKNCIHSWNVSFHASSSVDCGWTCQVRLQKFTWGLTRRTWWQQQEQFPYLSKKKQFTWFLCCEMKRVQEVFMTLLAFQLGIVYQIAWRSHRRRQTIWSQQWKQWGYWKLTFVQTSGLSCSTRHSCLHGVKKTCTQERKRFSS